MDFYWMVPSWTNECFKWFCKLLYLNALNTRLQVLKKHEVNVTNKLNIWVLLFPDLVCKEYCRKKCPPTTRIQRPAVAVALSSGIFLSFFFLVVSICFAGRFAVDGQRSCSHRVSCWLEGLVSIRGVKYRPVRHPDRADSHSCRAEEFLPAVKGVFQWKQACHQGGAELAVSATGRHSRYRLPLPFTSPAKSGSLVKSAMPPWSALPLLFS